MRDAIFGQNQTRGSVPNVPPPETGGRPVWNSGQVMQQSQSPGQYNQVHTASLYGGSQAPMGGGGSFLGTAAAAAAGVVGAAAARQHPFDDGGTHQALAMPPALAAELKTAGR